VCTSAPRADRSSTAGPRAVLTSTATPPDRHRASATGAWPRASATWPRTPNVLSRTSRVAPRSSASACGAAIKQPASSDSVRRKRPFSNQSPSGTDSHGLSSTRA
jgi:hypothetical protein